MFDECDNHIQFFIIAGLPNLFNLKFMNLSHRIPLSRKWSRTILITLW